MNTLVSPTVRDTRIISAHGRFGVSISWDLNEVLRLRTTVYPMMNLEGGYEASPEWVLLNRGVVMHANSDWPARALEQQPELYDGEAMGEVLAATLWAAAFRDYTEAVADEASTLVLAVERKSVAVQALRAWADGLEQTGEIEL